MADRFCHRSLLTADPLSNFALLIYFTRHPLHVVYKLWGRDDNKILSYGIFGVWSIYLPEYFIIYLLPPLPFCSQRTWKALASKKGKGANWHPWWCCNKEQHHSAKAHERWKTRPWNGVRFTTREWILRSESSLNIPSIIQMVNSTMFSQKCNAKQIKSGHSMWISGGWC